MALSLTSTLVVRAVAVFIHLMQHRGKTLRLFVEFLFHVAFTQLRQKDEFTRNTEVFSQIAVDFSTLAIFIIFSEMFETRIVVYEANVDVLRIMQSVFFEVLPA